MSVEHQRVILDYSLDKYQATCDAIYVASQLAIATSQRKSPSIMP